MQQISKGQQQGMGKWGWLATIIGLVFVAASVTLRLAPHYVDYKVIGGILDRLPDYRVHSDMSRGDIREHFTKQFGVENFRFQVRDILKVTRDRDQTVVNVTYEIREPIAYNADVVLSFAEERIYK